MTDRTDRVVLRGLRGQGRHGVLPQERRQPQPFVVDVVLAVDTAPAGAADDLALTVDYGEIARRAVAVVEGEPVDLLETLAARIASTCLDEERVREVEVTVHKPRAPLDVPFDDVAVTILRRRP